MREINEHRTNPVNDRLEIIAQDPAPDGACHHYAVSGFTGDPKKVVMIDFQEGPIPEAGVNGLTHEALLVIIADRLRAYQSGRFSCKENACALTKIEEALHWLQQRTLARMRRGVEGTMKV